MSASPTVRERFGLLRANYILDPATDYECFARDDIPIEELIENLRIDLETEMAPKRIVWGRYGGGKTHTLYKTTHALSTLTSIHPVHIECPNLGRRSTFLDLYRDGIMRQLGQQFLIGLLERVVEKVESRRRDEFLEGLNRLIGDEELASVAARLWNEQLDDSVIYAWISGIAISRGELRELRVAQSLAESEPSRLANMVVLIGKLTKQVTGETLVLVLDEMERMRSVGPETISTFVTGFTRLMDPTQDHVAILIGSSADQFDDMPDVFSRSGPVTSRLGRNSLIEIEDMSDATADSFIKRLIAYVRDPQADLQSLIAQAESETSERVDPALFPFTDEAIDALKSKLDQRVVPRDVSQEMTYLLGKAHVLNRSVVTANLSDT